MPTQKKRSNSKTNSLNSSLFKLPNGSIYNQPGQYRSTAASGNLGGGSGSLPAKSDTNPVLAAIQSIFSNQNYGARANAFSSAPAAKALPANPNVSPYLPSPQQLAIPLPSNMQLQAPNPYGGVVTRDSVLTGSYDQPSMAYSTGNISIAPPSNTAYRGGNYTGTQATEQIQPNQRAFTQENYNTYGTGRGYKRWWIGSGGNGGGPQVARGSTTQDPISGFSINWRVGAG